MAKPRHSEISIRNANRADVPLIRSLIAELADYERLAHEMCATDALLEQWLFGDKPAAEVVIGELAGQPAGFALFFHNFSTFLGRPGIYLEDLFVRPQARGNGLGLSLIRHLAKLARERGCGRLEWAVLNWNEPAIGFYNRLGAIPMNDWTIYRVTGDDLNRLASSAL